ncbi:MAG: vanadium-dependent haloperoxidase [Bacteroidetes bacterium]|nr:vanadium-dependent haloperoxidase [Bacteroidota bacterium]
MKKASIKLFLALLYYAMVISSCKREEELPTPNPVATNYSAEEKKQNNNDVPIAWMDMMTKLIKTTPGYTPPVASRALGYAGVALYEATVNGSGNMQSIASQIGMPAVAAPTAQYTKWFAAANACMAQTMRNFFPGTSTANKASIDSLELYFHNLHLAAWSNFLILTSEAYGKSVADHVYNWSMTDAVGHEGYLKNNDPNFVPLSGLGMWVPTPPAYAAPMQPHWGDVRPFVAINPFVVVPNPPSYSTATNSLYYIQAMEVYNTKNNLTPAQINIALYWADGAGTLTPPGHSMQIASQVIRKSNSDLFTSAMVFAKVGMAVCDAFIHCWKVKYTYSTMRPVTFIQQHIDANWTPLITTPPFPEYTSGHSTQSGAAARILSDIYGYNYSFVDHSKVPDGFQPRWFSNFMSFANEAALSRLYGGIHFTAANENGKICGEQIAANIGKLDFYK